MKFRFFLICIFYILFGNSILAQIAGVSGLTVSMSAPPIDKNMVEFEPNFFFNQVSGFRGEDGTVFDNPTKSLESGGYFRMCYGLSSNVEIGAQFDHDLSYASLSSKAYLYELGPLQLGAVGGMHIPMGIREYDPNQKETDDLSLYGLGLTISTLIGSLHNFDLNLQYEDYFNPPTSDNYSRWYILGDFGSYFLHEKLMTILSFQYSMINQAELPMEQNLSLFLALQFEFNDQMMFMLNTSHSVAGKNTDKAFGMNLACTFLLD